MAKCWVEHSSPTQRLLDFYQGKVREMRTKHLELTRVIAEAKQMVVKNADKEDETLRLIRNTSQLQDSLSEVQRYLYKEREIVLRLTAENDKLQVEKADDKRKINFLLEHCGMKESQLHNTTLDRLATPTKRKQKPKVRFRDVRQLNEKLSDFHETECDVLHLKIKALEAELNEQTEVLQDEIVALERDMEIRKKEWLSEKKLLEQQVSCLNCRLQNTQLQKFEEILQFLHDMDKERSREIKLMEENYKLRKSINTCKELFGDDFPDGNFKPAQHREELRSIKDQLQQKDKVIRTYQSQAMEFDSQMRMMRKEIEREREGFQKVKDRWSEREQYLNKKLEEERTRRLRESEGFRNDIKLLRSKLASIERHVRREKFKKQQEKPQTP